jgi:hypothetical protein
MHISRILRSAIAQLSLAAAPQKPDSGSQAAA